MPLESFCFEPHRNIEIQLTKRPSYTPVQARNRIISRYNIAQLQKVKLSMVQSAMIPHIRCVG